MENVEQPYGFGYYGYGYRLGEYRNGEKQKVVKISHYSDLDKIDFSKIEPYTIIEFCLRVLWLSAPEDVYEQIHKKLSERAKDFPKLCVMDYSFFPSFFEDRVFIMWIGETKKMNPHLCKALSMSLK